MSEQTVEQKKSVCRMRKQSLIMKILIAQPKEIYTSAFLASKTLKQLERIYEKVTK